MWELSLLGVTLSLISFTTVFVCFFVEINRAHIVILIPETLTSSGPNIAQVFIKDFVEKRIICLCVDSKSPLKKQSDISYQNKIFWAEC